MWKGENAGNKHFLLFSPTIFSYLLTISLQLMTQGAFMDSVDQDQTAQNLISDLHCPQFYSRL